MSSDPNERLTFDDIVMHPWTQGLVPSNEEVMKEFSTRFETCSTQITSTSTTTGKNDWHRKPMGMERMRKMNSQTTCVLSLLSLDDHLDVCVVAFSTSAFVNPDSTPLMTTIVTTPPTKLLQKVSNCYSSQHNSAELTRASTISLLDDFGKLDRECNQSGN